MKIRGGDQADQDNLVARSEQQIWESLVTRMGNLGTYCILQVNGQRKFFDPLDDSPPLADGCEVFIGRIPRDMYEDELVPLFASVGPIHELRLMMNFSGTNRGFAFVMYKQPVYAKRAIVKLNAFQVRPGQYIGVIQSVNNRRLYIGRLPESAANDREFQERLAATTEGLTSVTLYTSKKCPEQSEKQRRLYALAIYQSHRHAAMARRFLILHKNEIFPQGVTIDWACPAMEAPPSLGDNSDHSMSSNENKASSSASPSPAESVKAYNTKNSKSLPQNCMSRKLHFKQPPKNKEQGPTLERTSKYPTAIAPRFQENVKPKDPKASRRALFEMGPNVLRNNNNYLYQSNASIYDSIHVRHFPAPYSLSPVPKLDCVPCLAPEYEESLLIGYGGFRGSSSCDFDRMLGYNKRMVGQYKKRLSPHLKK